MLSRVTDNLYWMGRYLERAEHTARLIDVHLNLMLDHAPGMVEHQRLVRLLESLKVDPSNYNLDESDAILYRLTFEASEHASIIASIATARENAQYVREQISSEMWTQINQVYLSTREKQALRIWRNSPHEYYLKVREGSHLFQGITDATMNHDQGWQFIQIGRYMERITRLLDLMEVHLEEDSLRSIVQHGWREARRNTKSDLRTEDFFDRVATLKSVSAYEAYCKVYNPNLQPAWIVEFLLLNAEFPRSVRFCVDMILMAINGLADSTMRSKNMRLNRATGRLQSSLSYDDIEDVLSSNFKAYLDHIREQIRMIHDTLYDTYITYPIEAALQ